MRTIPLDATPNQSMTVTLDGRLWDIRVKVARDRMLIDLARDGIPLVSGAPLMAGAPTPVYPRLQTTGTFWLVTDGEAEPDWWEFGSTQVLIYISSEEL